MSVITTRERLPRLATNPPPPTNLRATLRFGKVGTSSNPTYNNPAVSVRCDCLTVNLEGFLALHQSRGVRPPGSSLALSAREFRTPARWVCDKSSCLRLSAACHLETVGHPLSSRNSSAQARLWHRIITQVTNNASSILSGYNQTPRESAPAMRGAS